MADKDSDPAPTRSPWALRVVWLVLCAAACTLFGPSFVRNLRPEQIGDFFQEWASARNVLEGLPAYTRQGVTMERYLGWRVPEGGFLLTRNAHPPTSILLALPLGLLDYQDAFLAWGLVSLASLTASLLLIARGRGIPLTPWLLPPTVTLLLACNPFRQQMHQGQLNLVLLLLLTVVWVLERSRRPVSAGLLLGFAVAVKLFPGLLFFHYLMRREWRLLAAGVAGVALSTLATLAVLGLDAYRDYVYEVMPEVSVYADWWPNLSLTGFWSKLFDGRGRRVVPLWYAPGLARTAIAVSSLVVLTLLARAERRATDRDRTFGLTLIAMPLLSPIAWDHYCLLLALPVVILGRELPSGSPARVGYFVCLAALWLTPLVYWRPLIPGVTVETWMTFVATPRQTLTALALQTYAVVGLFAVAYRDACRRRP